MKIALIRVATGEKYWSFYDHFYEITRENFFPEHELHTHVFTDCDRVTPRKNQIVHKVSSDIRWPEPCFRRYEWTLEAMESDDYDYVYMMDVDNFVDVRPPEALIQEPFCIVSPTEWRVLYGGGFWGGLTEFVRRFCLKMKADIDEIFNFNRLPSDANDEEFLYHCEELGCKVKKFHWSVIHRDLKWSPCSQKWMIQVGKDMLVDRKFQHKEDCDFGFFKGPVLINERMRVVLCFEKRSFNHYGRYEEIEPGKLKITWQEEQYGVSYLDLNATKDNN
jgi:hypothetical protein